MKNLPRFLLLLIVIILCAACGSSSATETPEPTRTSQPTDTSMPTATRTLAPTLTPRPSATSDPKEGMTVAEVIKVIDGDTIRVQIEDEVFNVRYIGVDTPESVHPAKDVEWMGPEAKEANEGLVAGQTIFLEKDVSETDQYGRLLRYVYVGDTMVNYELVRLGFAKVSTIPPDVKYTDLLVEAQREAREAERGLWSATPTPTPTNTPRPTRTPKPTATQTIQPTALPTQPPEPTAIPTQSQPTSVPTQPPQPTAVPTQPPQPTATPVPQPTEPPAPAPADVQITFIFFDGVVSRVESDEYAQITNNGGSAVNLAGWHINAGNPGQDFWFPSFEIQAGQSCRIYTNEQHPETCGFSFGSGQALWNNGGDCGFLYNAEGVEVSRYCY